MKQHPPHHTQPRVRAPIGLVAGAVIAGCILIGGIGFVFWHEWQLFSASAPEVAWLLRFIVFAIPVSLAAGYGYTGMVILWRRFADHRYLQADKVIGLTLAQRSQGLPATVQTLSYHDSHKELPAPATSAILELPAPETQIAPIPSFSQLLDQGQIGSSKPLILGYNADTGQAITGSWKDLYSCGIGALQGAGKSWLQAFLLAQSAAAGGRLIICDPHAGADESLSTRIAALSTAFMCNVASTDDEILTALRHANDKLENRKAGKGGDWEILIAVDEWTSLLRGSHSAECMAILLNISEQGRKYHTNAILSAQGWTKNAAGLVRQRLTSHYVLRQNQDEAGYQLGLKAQHMPADIRLLPDATGYFLNVRGELVKIVIPKMTPADIARCGEMIPSAASTRPTFGFTAPTAPLTPIVAGVKPERSQNVARTIAATTALQSATMAQPEAARAASLFVAGKSPAEIVSQLRGVKSSEGSRYQQALNEVLELIRQGVRP